MKVGKFFENRPNETTQYRCMMNTQKGDSQTLTSIFLEGGSKKGKFLKFRMSQDIFCSGSFKNSQKLGYFLGKFSAE